MVTCYVPVTVLGDMKDSSEQIILLYSHEDHIWVKRDNEKIKCVRWGLSAGKMIKAGERDREWCGGKGAFFR